ncbi:MAG TPA: hypothetical protein VF508_14580, partial [Pyrinomonadaceae bacterium]
MHAPRTPSPRARASSRNATRATLLILLATAAALCALLSAAGARPAAATAPSALAPEPPQTGLVDVTPSGGSAFNGTYRPASITPDGRYVVFSSSSPDLVANDTNGDFFDSLSGFDVFVRDRRAGRTTLVSVSADGAASGDGPSALAAVTPDGRYVAFLSTARNLVSPDPGGGNFTNVYLRDLSANKTVLVSQTPAGRRGNFDSAISGSLGDVPNLFISDDGRYVSFVSSSSDLVAGDTNSRRDAFVRDVQAGVTRLVSVNQAGTGPGDGETSYAVMTPDGRFVAFRSEARDLTPKVTGPGTQIYLRDMQAGTTRLVSANRFDGAAGNGSADARFMGDLDVSADGRYVAFVSGANDLVAGDANGSDSDFSQDVFVRDTVAGTTVAASANRNGTGTGAGHSGALSMTPDGRYVAFVSTAGDLVANDSN